MDVNATRKEIHRVGPQGSDFPGFRSTRNWKTPPTPLKGEKLTEFKN
jgi:hypothetical protein